MHSAREGRTFLSVFDNHQGACFSVFGNSVTYIGRLNIAQVAETQQIQALARKRRLLSTELSTENVDNDMSSLNQVNGEQMSHLPVDGVIQVKFENVTGFSFEFGSEM